MNSADLAAASGLPRLVLTSSQVRRSHLLGLLASSRLLSARPRRARVEMRAQRAAPFKVGGAVPQNRSDVRAVLRQRI